MLKILVFSLLFLCCRCGYEPGRDYSKFEEIDPSKYDYCKQNCDPTAKSPDDGYGTHAACNCTTVPDRTLVNLKNQEAIIKFRRDVVDFHNYWRNFSASGRETRPIGDPIPPAADMEVINYDLELEYIARCRALNSFFATRNPHENCAYMADGRPYGQNIFTSTHYWHMFEYVAIKTFYDEVRYLPNATIVNRFVDDMSVLKSGWAPYRHWSAMIWATVNRIGCVRSHQTNNAYDREMKYALICNYACDHTWISPNTIGRKIFTPGKPCSRCPKNKKCNNKYTALCGELRPVAQPRDIYVPPYRLSSDISLCCCFSGLVTFLLNYTLYFVFYKWFL